MYKPTLCNLRRVYTAKQIAFSTRKDVRYLMKYTESNGQSIRLSSAGQFSDQILTLSSHT